MARVYLADKDTLDSVNNKVGTANDAASTTPGSLFAGIKQLISVLSSHVAAWTSARAGKIDKLDLVQTTLNTPNGDTLAAWIKSISDNVNAANSNAANAANLASQANSNAWNAYQETINAKNWYANGGTDITLLNLNAANSSNGNKGRAGVFTAPEDGVYRIDVNATITNTLGTVRNMSFNVWLNPDAYIDLYDNTNANKEHHAFYAENLGINASYTGSGTLYFYLAKGQKAIVMFCGSPNSTAYGDCSARLNSGTVRYGKTHVS